MYVSGKASDLLDDLVVHLEGPELQAGRQLGDGGQREEELLCAAQGHLGVPQLGLLDPLLLLLAGGHGQDFLGDRRSRGGVKETSALEVERVGW